MDKDTEIGSCDDNKSNSSEKSSATATDACQSSADTVELIQHFNKAVKLSSPEALNTADNVCDSVSRTSKNMDRRFKMHSRLMYEITGINKKFSDILVEFDSTEDAVSLSGGGIEGTTVRFSSILFNKISETITVRPLRLLVPANYPASSPLIIDDWKDGSGRYDSNVFQSDLSVIIIRRFSRHLDEFSEPICLQDMARTWESSIKEVIKEWKKL